MARPRYSNSGSSAASAPPVVAVARDHPVGPSIGHTAPQTKAVLKTAMGDLALRLQQPHAANAV